MFDSNSSDTDNSDTRSQSAKPDVYKAICPSRDVLALIGEKWSSLIVGALFHKTLRFGELRRKCEGVSQKMLTKTLRRLEREGLVRRVAFEDELVQRVEYSLTDLGTSLVPIVTAAKHWAQENLKEIEGCRARYDQHSEQSLK